MPSGNFLRTDFFLSPVWRAIWRKTSGLLLFLFAALTCAASTNTNTVVPPAEKLLPADTLFVVSVPDGKRLTEVYQKLPKVQLWNDPLMKPFREKFLANWKEQFVGPVERELGIKLDDYSALLQGQLTFAITKEDWDGQSDAAPAALLLLDVRDQRGQLKTNLADLRQKWVDKGKTIRTEKIRDVEFAVIPLTTNHALKPLTQFLPQHQEIQELGKPERKLRPRELVIGQYESLLLASTSVKAIERTLAQLAGGSASALADTAAFEASRLTTFREAPIFAWLNASAISDVITRLPDEPPNSQAPSPLPVLSVKTLITATGLSSLTTAALAFRVDNDGTTLEIFLGSPEATRAGLLKMFSPLAKDANPPAFVPADAVRFSRYRIDGQKAVAEFEKFLNEMTWLSSWNFLLESGEEMIKVRTPEYDLRKDLFGNLGDDWITYEKSPRGTSPAELNSPPSIWLIGSPNPEKFVSALRGFLVILTADAVTPEEREFLGRKIYSVKIPVLPFTSGPNSAPRTLHYAASAGYVALSTDVPMLEGFLRSNEGLGKALRETVGLTEAAQKAGGLSTGWFGYENNIEAMRTKFQSVKKPLPATSSTLAALNPITSSIPLAGPEKNVGELMDYSLLPEFDKVANYFYFSVNAASANVDGIRFKFFSPTPPALRK